MINDYEDIERETEAHYKKAFAWGFLVTVCFLGVCALFLGLN